jgi:hypothetical protein
MWQWVGVTSDGCYFIRNLRTRYASVTRDKKNITEEYEVNEQS